MPFVSSIRRIATRRRRHGRRFPTEVTLPRHLRNRLARVILDALHDPEARRGLQALADLSSQRCLGDLPSGPLRDCFEEREGGLQLKQEWMENAAELCGRSGRAWRAISGRPLDPPDAPLDVALDAAGALFDAGLYYEVHEWLEQYWLEAGGSDREALQGLIQVAVALEHLARGNARGARSLVEEGCRKMLGRRLRGLDLDAFARDVSASVDRLAAHGTTAIRALDWALVPRFPRSVNLAARSDRLGIP